MSELTLHFHLEVEYHPIILGIWLFLYLLHFSVVCEWYEVEKSGAFLFGETPTLLTLERFIWFTSVHVAVCFLMASVLWKSLHANVLIVSFCFAYNLYMYCIWGWHVYTWSIFCPDCVTCTMYYWHYAKRRYSMLFWHNAFNLDTVISLDLLFAAALELQLQTEVPPAGLRRLIPADFARGKLVIVHRDGEWLALTIVFMTIINYLS